MIIVPSPAELMAPVIMNNESVNFTAGQSFTLECNFSVPDNLVTDPSVEWLNSTRHKLSHSRKLNLSHLTTSDGGVYTCSVTISIPELNISLTGVGNTSVIVHSK